MKPLDWSNAPTINPKEDAPVLLKAYQRVFDPECEDPARPADKRIVLADLARHCRFDIPFDVMLEYPQEAQLSVQEGRRTVFLRIKQFTEHARIQRAVNENETFQARTGD